MKLLIIARFVSITFSKTLYTAVKTDLKNKFYVNYASFIYFFFLHCIYFYNSLVAFPFTMTGKASC